VNPETHDPRTPATEELTADELAALVRRVFSPKPDDRVLSILIDLPDAEVPDRPEWKARRLMAAGWAVALASAGGELGLETRLYGYRNVRQNNADLPDRVALYPVDTQRFPGPSAFPDTADDLDPARMVSLDQALQASDLILAPTQFSTTAPLKVAAPKFGFRAATMPGFAPSMIGALRLDYVEINRRVSALTGLLTAAHGARIDFLVDGIHPLHLELDLRHRSAHASGGLFPEPGMVGNLPSGEAYIVPYEGEHPDTPSLSRGHLPVQFADGLAVYRIDENRAVEVVPLESLAASAGSPGPATPKAPSDGALSDPRAAAEQAYLSREPAYGNLAELGFGVLSDFGLLPTGEILLDEKLGLHIAFGRSEHFGGITGPASFTAADQVVHIDRVFLPEIQPRVAVQSVDLVDAAGQVHPLMRDYRYVIEFDHPPRLA